MGKIEGLANGNFTPNVKWESLKSVQLFPRGGIKFEIKGAIFGFGFRGAFEGAIFCPKFSLLRSKFKIFSLREGGGVFLNFYGGRGEDREVIKSRRQGGIEHPYAPPVHTHGVDILHRLAPTGPGRSIFAHHDLVHGPVVPTMC